METTKKNPRSNLEEDDKQKEQYFYASEKIMSALDFLAEKEMRNRSSMIRFLIMERFNKIKNTTE